MTQAVTPSLTGKFFNATVLVTSFGYLVDMFDFFLFNIVRGPSLATFGLSGTALTDAGLFISNFQMAGILLGGYAWGVLGDKFGRKSSLFASIFIYSLASLGCSFVQNIDTYAALRFLAGFGVAGELGVGVALVAEKLRSDRRGLGITFFISMGFVGTLLAVLANELLDWRTTYLIGGCAGLLLMIVRGIVMESGLYEAAARLPMKRGGFGLILRDWNKLKRYLAAVCLILPGTFAPQILWTLSPELALSRGIDQPVKASIVLAIGFFGSILADFIAVGLSEWLQSRKRASAIMLTASIISFVVYLVAPLHSKEAFLLMSGVMGVGMGCWVMGILMAAEQFGTNIRSTVASTVPSFARGMTIPMNLTFMQLKTVSPVFAATIIGCVIFALAVWGWYQLRETYGRDLDYVES